MDFFTSSTRMGSPSWMMIFTSPKLVCRIKFSSLFSLSLISSLVFFTRSSPPAKFLGAKHKKTLGKKTCLGFTHRLLCCNVCSLSLYAHPSPRRYHINKMAVLLTYESSPCLLPFPISQWLVRLLVYSGRTVCDFHTILFSLLGKPFYCLWSIQLVLL